MHVTLTPAAAAFIAEQGAGALSIVSVVFTSCCSGPLPPEVKPEAPADTDGFLTYPAAGLTVYYDSLLDPKDELTIDLKDYGTYRELFVQGWE